jgi:hypothetical protein
VKLPDWREFAKTCPRCNALYDGRFPAISRADDVTAVCSECGVDEAFIQFLQHKTAYELTQPEDWPVIRQYSLPDVTMVDGQMQIVEDNDASS